LRAQSAQPAPVPASADTARTNLVLLNPIGVVFSIYNGEYEHVAMPAFSMGTAGTYYKDRYLNYATVEAKFRYYPQEHAPDGFAVAMSAGVTHVSGDITCWDVCSNTSKQYPTLGVELDYNWLLGPTRRFAIGAGGGAKRLFGSHNDGSSAVLPTIRLAIGAAF
ncbi:MAG TPA: hypothetical protein VGT98_04780, partial [Candidatus Elarobacter sp.]|nr:hypothetical protein [Candidatus Elarobacter sp.]